MNSARKLRAAVNFHGHLGPWLVLGLMMGDFALKRLGARRHFGIKVNVQGASEKPKSCLIDGLQLSTGATYGKGNIQKIKSRRIQVLFANSDTGKNIRISLKETLIKKLESLNRHKDSEAFARKLIKINPVKLFVLGKGAS